MTERVAVVTGGASGIGRATVRRLVADGWRVVLGDLNAERAAETTADLPDGRTAFLRTDVSDPDANEALGALAVERWGQLDLWFNNAGIGGAVGPITEIEPEHWDLTFAVLVRSVFLGTKVAARQMRSQGWGGSIVNTASVAGLGGGGGGQAYSAAKAAVINLTLTTAVELAPDRIRVNAICPGLIQTPLALGEGERAGEVTSRVGAVQPWPDLGEPDHIAGVVAFLASDDAGFVTGETIRVDGGLVAAGPRLIAAVDPYDTWNRRVGMTYGTTGRDPEVRRLERVPPEPSGSAD